MRRAQIPCNSCNYIAASGWGDPEMYNQFFRLRENPFNVNPDPRYLFLTRQTRKSWEGLTRGVQARKGLLLLTGEVGTGKTTLLNHLLDWLHQRRAPVAFIFNSHLEISQLLDFVLTGFGVRFDPALKDNALMRLHQWLIERHRADDTPVVIVDEAQGLSSRVLEEIRMLLNLETSSDKLLQIVLAGQPELEERLQQPELRQVKQRIALRCNTAALSLEEAHRYVQARLHVAGADGSQIFASDAMDAVHFYSRGIPRVMNLLCEHALINASAEQIQPVPARFVAEVASEFQLDDSKPVASHSDPSEGPRSEKISVQSRFLNALVALTAAAEPVVCEERPYPPILRTSAWPSSKDSVFCPDHAPVSPVLDCDHFPDDEADPALFTPSSAALTPPAAPWRSQLQARLLSDWTAFFVEVGNSLPLVAMAEPVVQAVSDPAHPPRLHLVEAKPASALASSYSRRALPFSQNLSQASSKVDATKPTLRGVGRAKVITLRLTLVHWTLRWSNSFLTTATTTAWAPPPVILFQLPGRWLRLAKTCYMGFIARGESFVAAVSSVDWQKRKTTASVATPTLRSQLRAPARFPFLHRNVPPQSQKNATPRTP
jgi:general secretion pathway protein A